MNWNKSWKTLDEEYKDIDENNIQILWPSKSVSEEIVLSHMEQIWNDFIYPDGATPAFFPSAVVKRTRRRMLMVRYYGPHVFEESIMDHVRNVHREIRPQFLHSLEFQELRRRMRTVVNLPKESDFEIPYPYGTMLAYSDVDDFPDDRRFILDEMLTCRLLFTKLLTFLRESYNYECLLCYRKVLMFKSRMERGYGAVDDSWEIYRFFVAPGAPLEVSVSFQIRKKIMLQLAKPSPDIYDEVLRSVADSLSMAFSDYCTTPDYADLSRWMRDQKRSEGEGRRNGKQHPADGGGCFDFLA
jgi:hypothetical protein